MFLDQSIFPLVIHSGIPRFGGHLDTVMEGRGFFKNQNPCIPSWLGVFQFGTFLSVVLSESRCMSVSRHSSSPCNPFFMLFIGLSVIFFPIFPSKTVLLPLHLVVSLSPCIPHLLVSKFFFVIFEMFCLCCFTLSRYLLCLPSFTNNFLFISSSYTVRLVFCCFFLGLFIPIYLFVFFLP